MSYITIPAIVTFLFGVAAVDAISRTELGNGYIYRLSVVQDVWLERPFRNYNFHQELIVGHLRQFPKKRSLLQFENLGRRCHLNKIRWAKMYVYFLRPHKASWHSHRSSPALTYTINVHQIKRSWREDQATTIKRFNGARWYKPYLELGRDAELNPLCPAKVLYTWRPAGFVEFDVTNAVRGWASGLPNYGVMMKVVDEVTNGRGLRFASNRNRDRNKHARIHVKCDY